MRSKPLTYNRFRAYLRFRLRHKHFSKKRVIVAIVFYLLCSLSIFLLPLDILTKYPYLKYFTDFMDFIPAIKLMESKTYAPELCKFYASYMLVIGIVVLVEVTWQLCIWRSKITRQKEKRWDKNIKRKHIAVEIFYMIIFYSLMLFAIYDFLNGKFIGYRLLVDEKYHFIYNEFDMLWYVDYWQVLVVIGVWFFIMSPFAIGNTLSYRITKK